MRYSFNQNRGLIRVNAEIESPSGVVLALRLALDSGAEGSVINLARLLAAGYDPTLSGSPINVTTASQIVQAYRMPVSSLTALGQTRKAFPVIAHSLPRGASVDGLLGLDFIRGQILTIDFIKGEITLTPGPSTGATP